MSKNNLICWEENKENKWEMVKDGDDTNVFLLNLMRNKLVNQHTVFIVPVSGFVSGIWLQPQTHKSNRVDFWNFHKDFGSEYDKPKADEITSEVVKSVHEQYNDDTKYGWISPEGQYYHCCYQGHVDLAADVDMHRANEIRPVLSRLGNLAEKYGCAIILIGHMNKQSGSKSTYRGLGSIDIQATARSVLLVAGLKDKPNVRVMAQDKSSLAPPGDAMAFELSEDKGFECIGAYDITIDELLSGAEGRGKKKLDVAIAFIKEFMGDRKSVLSTEMESEASSRGIKRNTLLAAKKKLNISSQSQKSENGNRYWMWVRTE